MAPTSTPSSVKRDLEQGSEIETGGLDPELVLSNSADAMSRADSFAFDVIGHLLLESPEGETQIPLTYNGVSAAPDRSRATLVLNVFFFSLQIDLIIVGDTVWTTNPQTDIMGGGSVRFDYTTKSGACCSVDNRLHWLIRSRWVWMMWMESRPFT